MYFRHHYFSAAIIADQDNRNELTRTRAFKYTDARAERFYSVLAQMFPGEIDSFDLIELNWSLHDEAHFLSVVDNIMQGWTHRDVEDISEDLINLFLEDGSEENMTENMSTDVNKWTLRDVALVALYANIPMQLPGFERPHMTNCNIQLHSDAYLDAKTLLENYFRKYRQDVWSTYDVENVADAFYRLFRIEDSYNL